MRDEALVLIVVVELHEVLQRERARCATLRSSWNLGRWYRDRARPVPSLGVYFPAWARYVHLLANRWGTVRHLCVTRGATALATGSMEVSFM